MSKQSHKRNNLNRAVEEHAWKAHEAFQQMLASHGIVARDVDRDPSNASPEDQRCELAKHRDRRTRLGRG